MPGELQRDSDMAAVRLSLASAKPHERPYGEESGTRKSPIVAGLCAVVLSLPLVGCGGGGADVQTETRSTTTGQELLDLQKAREAGVINEAEYNKQRSMILNRKE
jgi:hypothetical protein